MSNVIIFTTVKSPHDFEAVCLQGELAALGWEFVGIIGQEFAVGGEPDAA